MDILGDLVGGQSCASDGTAASRNPISRLVDSLMEGSAGQHQKGRTRRAFGHGGDQGGTMVRPRTGVEPPAFTSSAAVDAAEARGMQGGNMPLGPGGGAGFNASHNAAAFQQVQLSYVRTPVGGLPPGHHAGGEWVNEFGNYGPPWPPASFQHAFNRDFQGAWGVGLPPGHPPPSFPPPPAVAAAAMMAADGAAAWANEFRHGPEGATMIAPHPAELEAAWAAQSVSQGGVPMVHGMPPGSMISPFQREANRQAYAHDADNVSSSAEEGLEGFPHQGGSDAATFLESTLPASTAEIHGETAAHSTISSHDLQGRAHALRDVSDVRASARALARVMGNDPERRFRDSELFRLVGRVGEGKLVIEGDKVVPASGAGDLEGAWREGAGVMAEAGAGMDGFEATWEGAAPGAEEQTSFSDAWSGLDSGVGAREEPAVVSVEQQHQEEAWAESESAGVARVALNDQKGQAALLQETMEAAWEEAKAQAADRGASGLDPDLEAVWSDPAEDDMETLEGVWRRTAARLEAGETGGAGATEVPYELSANNRFSGLSDPFEEGMRLFKGGQIADAALCFEAEIARNPENSQAWLMLGQSHAENDQDRLAISCLERAVEMDPYSLDALLALGTSYVNELDSQRALHNLKAWVQHNPKYSGLEITVDEYSDGTLMDEVMQLMLQAQRWDSTDPDAQVVLGVLYNVSRDYDSAAEAFRRALEARPNDHSLWNKLGATLANHRRSDEALPAYRRAIASKPGYARAWLNMGISQANLNRYEEASACYLQALRLNPEAKHIWSYLRIVLTCMERFDLVQKAAQEDAKLFEQDFDLALPAPP